ncbi:hypothetical protein [Microbulbifer sp. TYP-18]|uniref:hypothetical protein n=1 Tax=Microbulbifer sp. TYP-18 TaxID=3230024 RepID=UPI0034C6DC7D
MNDVFLTTLFFQLSSGSNDIVKTQSGTGMEFKNSSGLVALIPDIYWIVVILLTLSSIYIFWRSKDRLIHNFIAKRKPGKIEILDKTVVDRGLYAYILDVNGSKFLLVRQSAGLNITPVQLEE